MFNSHRLSSSSNRSSSSTHINPSSISMSTSFPIPILFLKTQSQPHDSYSEYFSSSPGTSNESGFQHRFQPIFIPVLEHTQNERTLSELGRLLQTDELKQKYGGIIFTSQRAVEAWIDAVRRVDEIDAKTESDLNDSSSSHDQSRLSPSDALHSALDTRTKEPFQTDILQSSPFPIYTVGPATSRMLSSLMDSSNPARSKPSTRFLKLNPTVHGSETGNGAALATFIQSHYNALHSQIQFTWHDAPRLPFVPLLGMGSENYSRRRLESDDPRLLKKPLLFLVGETRRDVIPRTLAEPEGTQKIQVEEIEVYSTRVLHSFENDLGETLARLEKNFDTDPVSDDSDTASRNEEGKGLVAVIVIFSPQGTATLLKHLNLIDAEGSPTAHAKNRWRPSPPSDDVDQEPNTDDGSTTTTTRRYIVVTIGPTTRDHLVHTFGVYPDVVASRPSPEGVREAVLKFLAENKGNEGTEEL